MVLSARSEHNATRVAATLALRLLRDFRFALFTARLRVCVFKSFQSLLGVLTVLAGVHVALRVGHRVVVPMERAHRLV